MTYNDVLLEEDTIIADYLSTTQTFQAPKFTNGAPEGYMTSDEFWGKVDENIVKRCKEYGLL